jgi:hypothetical protein
MQGEDNMPLLQVRDCPEYIYKEIALAAKRQNRTIAQQILVLLQQVFGQDQPNTKRRRQLLEKINSRSIPEAAKRSSAVTLVREDRDR